MTDEIEDPGVIVDATPDAEDAPAEPDPKNDPVEETDPEAEAPAGVEP